MHLQKKEEEVFFLYKNGDDRVFDKHENETHV